MVSASVEAGVWVPVVPRSILSTDAPEFPLAAGAVQPLRVKAEAQGSGDFSPHWAGQAARLGREMGAGELTRALATKALGGLRRLGGGC